MDSMKDLSPVENYPCTNCSNTGTNYFLQKKNVYQKKFTYFPLIIILVVLTLIIIICIIINIILYIYYPKPTFNGEI